MRIKRRKVIIFALLVITTTIVYSQLKPPRLFLEAIGYRHTGFENNLYSNFGIGLELFSIPYFAPEISYNYYSGFLNKEAIAYPINSNLPSNGYINTEFKANTITLSPKMYYGVSDEWSIFFLPKYSFGSIKAISSHYEFVSVDENRGYYTLSDTVESFDQTSFFSFGLGVEFYFIKSEKLSAAIIIEYTGIEANNVFKKIDFSEIGLKNSINESTQTLGLGLRFYFSPFKKKTP